MSAEEGRRRAERESSGEAMAEPGRAVYEKARDLQVDGKIGLPSVAWGGLPLRDREGWAEVAKAESAAPAAAGALAVVREQARRYLEAAHGTGIWYKAPEAIPNVLERWIWSVASSAEAAVGEESVAAIEARMKAARDLG